MRILVQPLSAVKCERVCNTKKKRSVCLTNVTLVVPINCIVCLIFVPSPSAKTVRYRFLRRLDISSVFLCYSNDFYGFNFDPFCKGFWGVFHIPIFNVSFLWQTSKISDVLLLLLQSLSTNYSGYADNINLT